MTIPGLVGDPPGDGDLDDHKRSSVQNFSFVQNFRSLGGVEADNSYNGVGRKLGRELGTFCVLSRVASQLKKENSFVITKCLDQLFG